MSGGRTFAGPNLARRPFTNRRPVARVSLLLAVAGLLLLVLNLFLYVGYVRTRAANATELRSIEAQIEAEREDLRRASATLEAAELDDQNELVIYLNDRIAERTFGWSVLFDRLSALLPGDVRLRGLTPRFEVREEPSRRRVAGGGSSPERRVELGIQGEAKDGEDLLQLLDALFADPAFRNPNLASESLGQGNLISFSLSVTYLPERAEALVDGDGGGGGVPADVADEPAADDAGEEAS